MILDETLKEAEVVDDNVKKEVIRKITDNMVDKIINLIKHRKRKPEKDEKEILYALKQGGIIE